VAAAEAVEGKIGPSDPGRHEPDGVMMEYNENRSTARDLLAARSAIRRGATRRDVLRGLVAGGMTIAMASAIATRAAQAQAETPRRGGLLRVAGSSLSTAETLDPARLGSGTDYSRGFMIYNALTRLDETLSPVPELAAEWSTADGIEWRFRLREGVTFHDGRPFTSADVVYSLLRHSDPKTASRTVTYTRPITAVRADGPHAVVITLEAPNFELPVSLGTFNLFIVPEGTTEFAPGIGTGPCRIEEFAPGVRSLVVRNDAYWKADRQPVDAIEYFGLPDESSRLNALRAGEIHLTTGINPRSAMLIERDGNIGLFVTSSGTFSDIIMRKTDATVGNPDFILGIKYLIQREVMKSSIYRDFADVANDHPIAPTMPYHDPSIERRPYDPELARHHLERAGVLGTTIPLVASAGVGNTLDMALILQQAALEVGLTIDVQRVPVDGYWSNVWMKALRIRHDHPAPDRRHDLLALLQVGRPLQLVQVALGLLRPDASCRPGRARRGPSPAILLRHAEDGP